jgi:hypothetical protein
MLRQGLLLPRFEAVVHSVLDAAVACSMALLLPGPGGPWRLPAARGRAVALRVEPPGYRRLAPDGLPSLTQHGQAGRAG